MKVTVVVGTTSGVLGVFKANKSSIKNRYIQELINEFGGSKTEARQILQDEYTITEHTVQK